MQTQQQQQQQQLCIDILFHATLPLLFEIALYALLKVCNICHFLAQIAHSPVDPSHNNLAS